MAIATIGDALRTSFVRGQFVLPILDPASTWRKRLQHRVVEFDLSHDVRVVHVHRVVAVRVGP